MARATRDLSAFQALCLIGAAAAFTGVIVVVFLINTGQAVVEETHARKRVALQTEPAPPADLIKVPEVALLKFTDERNPQTSKQQIVDEINKIRQMNGQHPDGYL